MIIDLHVHTTNRSSDSSLSTHELIDEALRIGLHGACLTEHGGLWDAFEFERIIGDTRGIVLIPAIEISTDMGHVTVFGLERYTSGISKLAELRHVADATGAYLVLAHPFRNLLARSPYNPNLLYDNPSTYPTTPEEAADHPALMMVDAIEVANSGNSKDENMFAWEVARYLGKPMIGGSDAHSVHGLGSCTTVFDADISSAKNLVEALRAGHFYPATGLNIGNLQPFGSSAKPEQSQG
jgi:predicted metal-dependent phosphoesterase TrpH